MQPSLPPPIVEQLIFTLGQAVQPIVASSSSSMNTFVHHLQSPCTIFDGTNYVTWSTSFWYFVQMTLPWGHFSFLADDPPLLWDPSHTTWFIKDQAIMAWLLKMVIHFIMSLCSSLHWPKLYEMNGLPCMPMSLIYLGSLRYMSSCLRPST